MYICFSRSLIGKQKCQSWDSHTRGWGEHTEVGGERSNFLFQTTRSCGQSWSFPFLSFMRRKSSWQRWLWGCCGLGQTPCHISTGARLRLRIKTSTSAAPTRLWKWEMVQDLRDGMAKAAEKVNMNWLFCHVFILQIKCVEFSFSSDCVAIPVRIHY